MTKAKTKVITLSTPIEIGDKTIKQVTLRPPTAGDLLGIAVSGIISMEAGAYMKLLPRITSPALPEATIAAMPVRSFTEIMNGVLEFFMTPDVA